MERVRGILTKSVGLSFWYLIQATPCLYNPTSIGKSGGKFVEVRGLVTIGDKVYIVKKGWQGHIPKGVKHRIQNDGPDLLVIKEHAEGEILSETDLIRYEDQYGRV